MDCITEDWLPDDAPWAELTKDVLKAQCSRRNLPVDGTTSALCQRLLEYQRANITEFRQRPWRLKPPVPETTDYACWKKRTHPVSVVEDLSDRQGFKMRFTFAPCGLASCYPDSQTSGPVRVLFTNKPSCSCRVSVHGFQLKWIPNRYSDKTFQLTRLTS